MGCGGSVHGGQLSPGPESWEAGARVLPQEAAARSQCCLAIVGRGDLAHYRGGKRIKSSRGWKSGVDAEDAVTLETACLVLGCSRLLWGWGQLFIERLWGPLQVCRVGDTEKRLLHVACMLDMFSPFSIHDSLGRDVG